MKKEQYTLEELKNKLLEIKKQFEGPLLARTIKLCMSIEMVNVRENEIVNVREKKEEGYYLVHIKNGFAKIPYFIHHNQHHLMPEKVTMLKQEELSTLQQIVQEEEKNLNNLKYVLDKQKIRTLFI